MPVKSYWLDEPHIWVNEHIGNISEEEMEAVVQEDLELVEKGPVYFLIDMTQLKKLPNNLMRMGPVTKLLGHSNTRYFVNVNMTPFAKIATQIIRFKKVQAFDTRDEAVAFLREKIAEEQPQKQAGNAS